MNVQDGHVLNNPTCMSAADAATHTMPTMRKVVACCTVLPTNPVASMVALPPSWPQTREMKNAAEPMLRTNQIPEAMNSTPPAQDMMERRGWKAGGGGSHEVDTRIVGRK